MGAAAPHRGSIVDQVQLGDCILAITDSGYPGSVDLVRSGALAAAFSGSFDNLADFRSDVKAAGGNLDDRSPAAALLAGFQVYGDDLPSHLRGAFTGIVTDGARMLAFRDHLGYGTLYYRSQSDAFYVATEAKQVLAGSRIQKEPDLEVLEQVLYKTYNSRTPSALRGVNRLPKASVILVDGHGARSRRYWNPESILESSNLSAFEVQERFDELMTTALQRTVTGEDIVSLSGGIDSPAVAAFAAPEHARITGAPLPAFSIVFPSLPNVDERGYVELVAEHLGMPLHLYEQTARPLDDVQEWAALNDGPVPTVSLPQYKEHYLKARSLGARNILTGEVAELVFDMTLFRFPHLLLHGRLDAVWRDVSDRRQRGAPLGSIVRSLLSAFVPTPMTTWQWRRRDGAPAWVDSRKANETAVRSIVPPRDRWRKVQVSWMGGAGISMEADEICQDLCGVRNRRPWTDVDLWEFFLSLRAEVKYPDAQSKTLVRRLLRGKLPDAILDRRDKTAFDDSIMASVDYDSLRRWLLQPSYRMPGVRYDLLRDRLEHEDMGIEDIMWAKDLASIHAFLALW
jgi:asparagine synthase (glutamine-hydrolysing)